ncbi:hypothetical protein SAMN05216466_102270 [Paraburkholderia phenazinium]|uniref:Uncharacterized protein n=1 Tax=Paraburkholderia phenazinium TaxID=60549 RepID=A0A1G7RXJ1_9BURK|nr:hypothetical protein SAMN05216466_102270 [Paraburkholderia phenazinium]
MHWSRWGRRYDSPTRKTEEPLEQYLLLLENQEGGMIPVISCVIFGGEPRLKVERWARV